MKEKADRKSREQKQIAKEKAILSTPVGNAEDPIAALSEVKKAAKAQVARYEKPSGIFGRAFGWKTSTS